VKQIDITKGIEAFDDTTDFTRGNKDRRPFGKSDSAVSLHLGDEYDTVPPTATPEGKPEAKPAPETQPPPAPKFTHKLANGTVLEAASVEELATLIEKSIQQTPAPPQDFEDKPLYSPYEFKPKELSLQEQANILNLWKENPQKALRMLQEADLGAPAETIIRMLNDTQQVVRQKLEEEAGAEFLMDADTYNPTPANGKKLVEHLKAKGKPITRKNLFVAFQQLLQAGDKSLLRAVDPEPPEAEDETLTETPPPPAVIPSNQGRPEVPNESEEAKARFANEFASWPLRKQQEYFAKLKRGA
jgi:hypothetical protein